MIRGVLTRRAEWPARIPDPDAPPPLSLLWREVGALLRAIAGRIRPMPPEPNPDSEHPPVMVLPGFLSGDWATKALRGDLRRAGLALNADRPDHHMAREPVIEAMEDIADDSAGR